MSKLKKINFVKHPFLLILIFSLVFLLMMGVFSRVTLGQMQWNDVNIYPDIPYFGKLNPEHSYHLLDIYQPEDCNHCPVVLYIHGGTWVLGDKGSLSYKAKALTQSGYLYISMNYRLAPEFPFPAQAYDVARAIRWIKENISQYGGEPERIFLLGHSAGGHLAALVTLDETYLSQYQIESADLAGIIGLDSAAYHLPSLFEAEPENKYLFEWAFGSDEQDWQKASPVNYIRKGLDIPPFLLLVAGGRSISTEVNQYFYQKLHQFKYDVAMKVFNEQDHVSIDYDLGKSNDLTFPVLRDWLEKQQQ